MISIFTRCGSAWYERILASLGIRDVEIALPHRARTNFIIEVWLSLVERYVRDVEVASSNLVTSTIEKRIAFAILFSMVEVTFERAWLLQSNSCKFAFTARRSGSSLTRRRASESSPQANTLFPLLSSTDLFFANAFVCRNVRISRAVHSHRQFFLSLAFLMHGSRVWRQSQVSMKRRCARLTRRKRIRSGI